MRESPGQLPKDVCLMTPSELQCQHVHLHIRFMLSVALAGRDWHAGLMVFCLFGSLCVSNAGSRTEGDAV